MEENVKCNTIRIVNLEVDYCEEILMTTAFALPFWNRLCKGKREMDSREIILGAQLRQYVGKNRICVLIEDMF